MTTLAKVEDIPDHKVKTTLQKAIQLLKRHRDNMFSDDPDAKPISIIITTLAAHSYGNEGSLVDALSIILRNMDSDKFIEDRDGEKWVANPVNPAENFADKWAEDPTLQTNFYMWLDQARRDFGAYLNASPADELPVQLTARLGQPTVNKVVKSLIASAAISTAAPVAAKVKQAVETVHSRGTGTAPYCPIRGSAC